MGTSGHNNRQMRGKRTNAPTVAADERRRRALELRMKGYTYKEIGKALGCNQTRARVILEDIVRERTANMDELVRENAEMAIARLDQMVRALWDKAVTGHIESILALVRVEERRAKLLGLDAPQRVQTEVELRALPQEELLALARRVGLGFIVLPPADHGGDARPLMLGHGPVVECGGFAALPEPPEPDLPAAG